MLTMILPSIRYTDKGGTLDEEEGEVCRKTITQVKTTKIRGERKSTEMMEPKQYCYKPGGGKPQSTTATQLYTKNGRIREGKDKYMIYVLVLFFILV